MAWHLDRAFLTSFMEDEQASKLLQSLKAREDESSTIHTLLARAKVQCAANMNQPLCRSCVQKLLAATIAVATGTIHVLGACLTACEKNQSVLPIY